MLAALAVAAAAGFWMSLTTPELPGTEELTLEDGVDAVGIMLFGVLGLALVAQDRAAGLGKALILMASMIGAGLLPVRPRRRPRRRSHQPVRRRAVTQRRRGVGVRGHVLPARHGAAAPLPDRSPALTPLALGRRCRDRRLRGRGALGPARSGARRRGRARVGGQPDRARRRARLVDALEMVGLVLLAGGMLLGLGAFITRWVRYRGPRRRQMAWFTIGVVVLVPGLATDTDGDSVTVEVLLATAIFATMLFGIGWPLLGPLGARADAAEHPTSGEVRGGADPRGQLGRRSWLQQMSNPFIHHTSSARLAREVPRVARRERSTRPEPAGFQPAVTEGILNPWQTRTAPRTHGRPAHGVRCGRGRRRPRSGCSGRCTTRPSTGTTTLGFRTVIEMKVVLTAVIGVLAVLQVVGALWLYGKLGIGGAVVAGYGAPRLRNHRHCCCRCSSPTTACGRSGSRPARFHDGTKVPMRTVVHGVLGCAVIGAVGREGDRSPVPARAGLVPAGGRRPAVRPARRRRADLGRLVPRATKGWPATGGY